MAGKVRGKERMTGVRGGVLWRRGLEVDGWVGVQGGLMRGSCWGERGEARSRAGTATDRDNHRRGAVRSTYHAPRTRTSCSGRSNPAYDRARNRQNRGRLDLGSYTGRRGVR